MTGRAVDRFVALYLCLSADLDRLDRRTATRHERVATIDAVRVRCFRPGVGVPREPGDADQAALGCDLSEVLMDFLDEERATRILRGT